MELGSLESIAVGQGETIPETEAVAELHLPLGQLVLDELVAERGFGRLLQVGCLDGQHPAQLQGHAERGPDLLQVLCQLTSRSY